MEKKQTDKLEMREVQRKILSWIEDDKEKIVDFFSKLVQCPTPSDPGDTRAAMELIKTFLEKEGLPYREVTADEIMPNLITSVETPHAGRHLMFNGHLDVMPAGQEPGWTDNPWSGKVDAGKVWGRGTSDMKAGITAMIFAYAYLARLKDNLSGKFSLTVVSDEETGYGRGTGFMFDRIPDEMKADCVLSGEPSGSYSISYASKGYVQFSVAVTTRGAIAGYSNETENAIYIANDIICELREVENMEVKISPEFADIMNAEGWLKEHIAVRGEGHGELLTKVAVDVCTFDAGCLHCVIPSNCRFSVTVTIPVGVDPYQVIHHVKAIVEKYPEAVFKLESIDSPDISDPDGEMAEILKSTVADLGWDEPVLTPDIAISDCRYWRYKGTPAYWYGPDGADCSAANEFVSIEELLHVVRTHALSAVKYLLSKPSEKTQKHFQLTEILQPEPKLKLLKPIRVVKRSMSVATDDFAAVQSDYEELRDKLFLDLSKAGINVPLTPIAAVEQNGNGYTLTAAYPADAEEIGGMFETVQFFGAGAAATAVHRGSNEDLPETIAALRAWMRDRDCTATENYYIMYIIANHNYQEQWAMEIIMPLANK